MKIKLVFIAITFVCLLMSCTINDDLDNHDEVFISCSIYHDSDCQNEILTADLINDHVLDLTQAQKSSSDGEIDDPVDPDEGEKNR